MDIGERENSNWHSMPVEDVLARLNTSRKGLTGAEAAERLSRFGPNEVARRKPPSPLRLVARQFSNFFIWVLLFAGVLALLISFTPGEADRRLTAYFIFAIVAFSVALGFFQERRAQKSLAALGKLLVARARVMRDGVPREVDASEVVPGDVLILSHGQKVPADARIIEAHLLQADESALTGESLNVLKSPAAAAGDAPLAERTGIVFASTFLTSGSGLAAAVRTGMATEVGQIAGSLQEMAERPTPFQLEVKKMARQMTVLVALAAVFVAVLLLFVLKQSLADVALNTLSLAVATIPESLPIVLVFALALGARQMAARNVVVRRLSVVESLGSVDTVCSDKTGTLTQNVMTVQRLYADGGISDLAGGMSVTPDEAELLRTGILCNDASAEKEGGVEKVLGDPVEKALYRAERAAGLDVEAERAACPRVDEIPFTSERKMMTTVHKRGGGYFAATKGSPEAVIPKCRAWLRNGASAPLDDAARETLEKTVEQLESEGWYVLAFATKSVSSAHAIDEAEENMTLVGLQAMRDPPRPGAREAIEQCRGAGIRVVMITGDNERTARAIGRQMGIGEEALASGELEKLSRPELAEKMKRTDIVARAAPQTKQHVLRALQDEGHFVAMTGDGVNDAMSLKQADVGVAMGRRGTDIAKESSDMVLLDDNFSTIVAGIEEGRRIFDNIRKFTNYLLSTTIGSLVVVIALSVAGYFPLSPRMLLWVNLVTDLIPASALAADPAVRGVLKRRPRRKDEPIMNKAIYATIGGSVFRTLIAYCLLFWIGLQLGGLDYARTMLFTSIVLHAFTRVIVVRQLDRLSIWSNKALLISYAVAVGLQLLALYTPLRGIFGVVELDWRAWAVMVPVVALSSTAGVYMTRWILKIVPLWEK